MVLSTFQPCHIEDLVIEGSASGYLENLLHVDCLEAPARLSLSRNE